MDARSGQRCERSAHADTHQDQRRADAEHEARRLGDLAEPGHPGGGQEQAADEQRQVADPRGNARDDAHEREQHERHRQERQSGLKRRLAAHVLQVLGQEEEHREHAADREHARDIGAGPGAAREQPQRRDRLLGAALDAQERREQQQPGGEGADGDRVAPTLGRRADEAVDDAGHAGDGGRGTGEVEVPVLGLGVGEVDAGPAPRPRGRWGR